MTAGCYDAKHLMEKSPRAEFTISRYIVVIGVLASLLFSVGEGLRLTPFPSSILQPKQTSTDQSGVTSALGAVVADYGPIDVPTQVRKRAKRQFLDSEVPPSTTALEPTTTLGSITVSGSLRRVHPFSGSNNAGRAPPC